MHINAHRFKKKCLEEAYKHLGKGVVWGGRGVGCSKFVGSIFDLSVYRAMWGG